MSACARERVRACERQITHAPLSPPPHAHLLALHDYRHPFADFEHLQGHLLLLRVQPVQVARGDRVLEEAAVDVLVVGLTDSETEVSQQSVREVSVMDVLVVGLTDQRDLINARSEQSNRGAA